MYANMDCLSRRTRSRLDGGSGTRQEVVGGKRAVGWDGEACRKDLGAGCGGKTQVLVWREDFESDGRIQNLDVERGLGF